jgi:hypothetical protein
VCAYVRICAWTLLSGSLAPGKQRWGRGTEMVVDALSRQKKKSSWGLGSSGDKNMRMYVTMPVSHARAAPNVPEHLARSLARSTSCQRGCGLAVSAISRRRRSARRVLTVALLHVAGLRSRSTPVSRVPTSRSPWCAGACTGHEEQTARGKRGRRPCPQSCTRREDHTVG